MSDAREKFEKYLTDYPPMNKPVILRASFCLTKFRVLIGTEVEINVELDVTKENARYIVDQLIKMGAKTAKEAWKEQIEITKSIRPITLEMCVGKFGEVERGDPINKLSRPTKTPEKSGVMNFGKFKGRSYEDVKNSQPSYWAWCLENVEGFEKKVKHLQNP